MEFQKGRISHGCYIYTFSITLYKEVHKSAVSVLFINYEKAYDSLNKEIILNFFTKETVPTHLIEAIQSVCQNKKVGSLLPNRIT
jgi:hypothetical protein